MTCIVGYTENKKVYIGGDSASIADFHIDLREDKKVFKRGEIIFGFTSSFRMGQILNYSFVIPEHDERKSDFEYLCTDFVDALIDQFINKGYAKINSNEVSGGFFLLGYKGRLYGVESDFQVSELIKPYDSCGCGSQYAIGALHAIEDQSMPPEERIKIALRAAECFSAGVRSPFTIVSV